MRLTNSSQLLDAELLESGDTGSAIVDMSLLLEFARENVKQTGNAEAPRAVS